MTWTSKTMPDDAPLWTVLHSAYREAVSTSGVGTPNALIQDGYVAEIEALREWLFERTCDSPGWDEVRDLLTEQARLARGDQ